MGAGESKAPLRVPTTAWALAIFVPVTLLLALGLWLVHQRQLRSDMTVLRTRAQASVRAQNNLVDERLRTLMGDALIVASLTALGDDALTDDVLDRIENEFLQVSRFRGFYDQIRLLSDEGVELVRIRRADEASVAVPPPELQDRSGRAYYQQAMRSHMPGVYVSAFDLSPRDEPELTPSPTVCVAVNLRAPTGALRGVVVVNYDASDLLDAIADTGSDAEHESMVLNQEGYWLLGRASGQDWAFVMPQRAKRRFESAFPAEWAMMREADGGQFRTDAGLFSYRVSDVSALAGGLSRVAHLLTTAEGDAQRLWIVHRVSPEELAAVARSSRDVLMASYLSISALLLVGALVVASLLEARVRDRAALLQLAEVDALTGVWNRRKVFALATLEMQRAQRYGTAFSLAVIDLDHFKRVNDRWGHLVGDQALIHVARQMRAAVRDIDAIGRFGGEEFIVLLPSTDEIGASSFGDRLLQRLAAHPLPQTERAPELRISASVGVAQRFGEESLESLVERADDALFHAKRHGRNQTVAASVVRSPVPTSGVTRVLDLLTRKTS